MDGPDTIQDSRFPYGRLAVRREVLTNISADATGYSYISALQPQIEYINPANVLSVGTGGDMGALVYRLRDGSDAYTDLVPAFRTEDDVLGNRQYAISVGSGSSYVKAFENRLSSVTKCSEQDWTMYYDKSASVDALCVQLPVSA